MANLFVPGPVDVNAEVMAAQTQPMLPHRSAEFEEIFHRAENNARKIFKTQSRVFLTASSGTGLHEAAVRNLANSKTLACVNGAFGSRWQAVAESNGKLVDIVESDWQAPLSAQAIAEALGKQDYEILILVHNETSTGLVNPIEEIAAAARNASPNTLICVDAVSSWSGDLIAMDDWGLDLVLTSSQKALALPPGLSLAAVNDRALARAEKVSNRGWYFDFLRLEKHRLANSTPATPAISLIYALDLQLKRIAEEGLENRFARHTALAEMTHAWALENGLDLFAPEGYRSRTVTTIDNKLAIDVAELNAFLLERGMRIANGYGPLKDKTFRIGHMGEIQLSDLEVLFAAIEEFLIK
jgi:predicted phosphoserine aminotransferase